MTASAHGLKQHRDIGKYENLRNHNQQKTRMEPKLLSTSKESEQKNGWGGPMRGRDLIMRPEGNYMKRGQIYRQIYI